MRKNWTHYINQIRCEILRDLIGQRCAPNNVLFLSKTPMEVHFALRNGADPNADHQHTARSLIRFDGLFSDQKYDCLNALFDAGLKPNAVNNDKKTLLHECTDERALHILLNNNVNHGLTDVYGCTAIQTLLSENAWSSAKILLDSGVSLKDWGNDCGLSLPNILTNIVRFWALWPDDVIASLLEKILPETPCISKWSEDIQHNIVSGLHSAHQHKKEWVRLFSPELLKECDMEDETQIGYPKVFKQSPLWLAAGCNDVGVVQYMLNAGCNINETDARGQTALHAAVASQSLQTVEILLQAGANPNAQDLMGKTCLHTLQRLQKTQHFLHADMHHFNIDLLLACLLHYGAKTTIVDHSGVESGARLDCMIAPAKDLTELNMQISVKTYNALLDIHCRDTIAQIVEGLQPSAIRRM